MAFRVPFFRRPCKHWSIKNFGVRHGVSWLKWGCGVFLHRVLLKHDPSTWCRLLVAGSSVRMTTATFLFVLLTTVASHWPQWERIWYICSCIYRIHYYISTTFNLHWWYNRFACFEQGCSEGYHYLKDTVPLGFHKQIFHRGFTVIQLPLLWLDFFHDMTSYVGSRRYRCSDEPSDSIVRTA